MASNSSASRIRSAQAKAVGGGRKRCRKGKNCSATCIASQDVCLVELTAPTILTTLPKVVAMLQGRRVGVVNKSTSGLTTGQKEIISAAAGMTNTRIDKVVNERQFYDAETNAKIKARNEAIMAPFQKLNSNEKAAVALYGENNVKYFEQVNQLLRTGKLNDSTPDKVRIAEFVNNNLRSGLEKLPPAKVEELQRAVTGGFAQNLGKLKVGDVIQDKGFGSYTGKGAPALDQFIKKDQENAVIKVLNSSNAREVAPIMQYSKEGEHIYLPGSKFRLVGTDPKGTYSRRTGGYIPTYTFEEVQ